jgi:hypothetical protein
MRAFFIGLAAVFGMLVVAWLAAKLVLLVAFYMLVMGYF